ncbi:hypothetical protein WMY93_017089 [Mugilogobius chulae]|uniref:Uncharacterized protein n=1 Tax=Mugilogobius chulae TaxID=88201 RepID=A0AAW0NXF6_9GOBI
MPGQCPEESRGTHSTCPREKPLRLSIPMAACSLTPSSTTRWPYPTTASPHSRTTTTTTYPPPGPGPGPRPAARSPRRPRPADLRAVPAHLPARRHPPLHRAQEEAVPDAAA